jgi:hypothetical protein
MDHEAPKNEIDKARSIAVYDGSEDFVYLSKKTEKLVSAVYLITGLFPENDPIRQSLRSESTKLMSLIIDYRNASKSIANDAFVSALKDIILKISSYLEICLNTNLISKMNFEIVNFEFIKILNDITTKNDELKAKNGMISSAFFNIELSEASKLSSQYKDDLQSNSKYTEKPVESSVQNSINHEVKRSSRQNTILGLIKRKKEVTIKDVSEVIKNCSEKTIQRELILLISSGVLKRVGERRWSKYSLV